MEVEGIRLGVWGRKSETLRTALKFGNLNDVKDALNRNKEIQETRFGEKVWSSLLDMLLLKCL